MNLKRHENESDEESGIRRDYAKREEADTRVSRLAVSTVFRESPSENRPPGYWLSVWMNHITVKPNPAMEGDM